MLLHWVCTTVVVFIMLLCCCSTWKLMHMVKSTLLHGLLPPMVSFFWAAAIFPGSTHHFKKNSYWHQYSAVVDMQNEGVLGGIFSYSRMFCLAMKVPPPLDVLTTSRQFPAGQTIRELVTKWWGLGFFIHTQMQFLILWGTPRVTEKYGGDWGVRQNPGYWNSEIQPKGLEGGGASSNWGLGAWKLRQNREEGKEGRVSLASWFNWGPTRPA